MSLLATRLQNWRVQNPELDRNMTRPCEYGALDFFIEQTNAQNSIISPNLRDRAFASIGNTVQVPVINYDGDVTVSNTRSCVIADDENTYALDPTHRCVAYIDRFALNRGRSRRTENTGVQRQPAVHRDRQCRSSSTADGHGSARRH